MPHPNNLRHRPLADRSPLARAAAAASRALARNASRHLLADHSGEELTAVFSDYCTSLPVRERERLQAELAVAGISADSVVDALVIWFRAQVRSTRARLTAQPALPNAGRCGYPGWEMPCGMTQ